VIVSGEPLLSPLLFLRSLALRRDSTKFSKLLGGPVQMYSLGRQALAEALTLTNISAGRVRGRVLVPALICDTVIHAVQATGWQWRYYRIGADLIPDWDWLERHAEADDRAMLLVHYFGFPSDVARADRFTQSRGLALIEDCAHAFMTALMNPVVGHKGQAAVYSWRKFLPVGSGGALVVPPEQAAIEDRVPLLRSRRTGAMAVARELGKWLMFTLDSTYLLERFGPALSDEPHWAPDAAVTAAGPDAISERILAAEVANLNRIVKRRRENYKQLYDSLKRLRTASPLTPPLQDGVVPWCLPVVVNDDDTGKRLVEHLLRRGIGAWSWPALPEDVTGQEFPRETQLAARTVCLPVHQSLAPGHLQPMTNVLKDWDRS
jgi:dTDP-4-amino-4,6-dideoxygalactose transaminase